MAPDRSGSELSAAAQVAQFQAAASSDAFMLACWLAVPVLNIPVMRLVQRAMMPRASVMVLAEVLLSGLIKKTSSPSGDGEKATYGFGDAVREILLDYLTSDETLAVKRMLDRVARRSTWTAAAPVPSRRSWPTDRRPRRRVPPTGPSPCCHRPPPGSCAASRSSASPRPMRTGPRSNFDPNAPLVFLSYARTRDGRRPGHTEMRFFEDLVEVVSEFGPWPEPGSSA